MSRRSGHRREHSPLPAGAPTELGGAAPRPVPARHLRAGTVLSGRLAAGGLRAPSGGRSSAHQHARVLARRLRRHRHQAQLRAGGQQRVGRQDADGVAEGAGAVQGQRALVDPAALRVRARRSASAGTSCASAIAVVGVDPARRRPAPRRRRGRGRRGATRTRRASVEPSSARRAACSRTRSRRGRRRRAARRRDPATSRRPVRAPLSVSSVRWARAAGAYSRSTYSRTMRPASTFGPSVASVRRTISIQRPRQAAPSAARS